jgi:translation initiation factor eIF-2B subunit beta
MRQAPELVTGNMVRRVIKFLREEYNTELSKILPPTGASTPALTSAAASPSPGTPEIRSVNRTPILDAVSSHSSSSRAGGIFDLLGNRGLFPIGLSSTSFSAVFSSPEHGVPHSMHSHEFSRRSVALKPIFIDAIGELMEELDMVYDGVANQAGEHIHSAYVVVPDCVGA